MVVVRCEKCDRGFNVRPSYITSGRGKYCSNKCQGISKRNKISQACIICDKEVISVPSRIKKGRGKYCSILCMGKGRSIYLIKPIVWKVDDNSCWNCTSHAKSCGYPQISRNNKTITLHRFMYEKHKGPIPKGMLVRHSCDNPGCINPRHLLVGSCADNSNDMVSRHRQARGETSGMSKLTELQVLEIYNNRSVLYTEFAKKFNVTSGTICSIQKGKTWRHITQIKTRIGGDE